MRALGECTCMYVRTNAKSKIDPNHFAELFKVQFSVPVDVCLQKQIVNIHPGARLKGVLRTPQQRADSRDILVQHVIHAQQNKQNTAFKVKQRVRPTTPRGSQP